MRTVYNFNAKWAFTKQAAEPPARLPMNWNWVNLPHTWNAIDGQDGGNDYYRGTCWYAKSLDRRDLPRADRYYIEFRGANSSADFYLNGKKLASHDGGYSTWRVDITEELQMENLFAVAVDNAPNERVYPQVADFTFYGGLYRDVNIICVNNSHFDL
ncbi:MAG: glycoside hydrolase family 2 protein, partial [Oscillospiraceae bacterium]|nr:glycoside hydrolase family 2 protein [Oscillospiraceae bacterium]